jgi:serine/threonine protein kinase
MPLRPADPAELGAYVLRGVIGQGSQGTVYLAADSAGELVAIKVMSATLDKGARERLLREVTAARKVPAYCTARTIDVNVEADSPYVVTEFIDGPTLDLKVRKEGPFGIAALELLAIGMASALVAVHDAGVVHRDLKPANVILSSQGPRVLDFGVARHEDLLATTIDRGIVGTPAFMAPELFQGRPASPASDVFAWGLTIAFAALGRTVFQGETLGSMMHEIMHAAPVLDGVPERLRKVVGSALEKLPQDRPSAREILQQLLWSADTAIPATMRLPPAEDHEASYGRLTETARTLLRRSALVDPGKGLDVEVATLLLDTGVLQASAAVEELTRWGFLRSSPSGHAFATDVWAFAQRKLTADEPGVQSLLLARLRLSLGERSTARPQPIISRDFWTIEDRLGVHPYASAVAAFIRYPQTEPPLTIGISGAWGSGKTSLMRMIREQLDPQDALGERTRIELSAQTRRLLRFGSHDRLRNRDVLRRARDRQVADPPLTADPVDRPDSAPWRPTVWFNPWMYQTGEQIWAGFAHEIITQITDRLTPADRERFWLEVNLRRIDREEVRRRAYRIIQQRILPLLFVFVVAVVVATAGVLFGYLWPGAARGVRVLSGAALTGGTAAFLAGSGVRWWGFLRGTARTSFGRLLDKPEGAVADTTDVIGDPGYRARVGFLHLVQSDMRRALDLVVTADRPLVVFIDDLDRCVPGQVAQVVEAVNLFLAGEFPNCVFIIAMEPDMVAAHIETAYADLATKMPGDKRLGWHFLEKVVQLSLRSPRVSRRHVSSYLAGLLGAAPQQTGQAAQHRPQDWPRPVPDRNTPDPALVADLTERIRSRRPTLSTLSETARHVQREALGVHEAGLHPATVRAFDRVFADLYGTDVTNEALQGALGYLEAPTVRTIKRYVNLFRFLTFIAHHEQLDQGSLAPSPAKLAKLAALHMRWPYLIGRLLGEVEEGRPLLAELETLARGNDPTATWPNLSPFFEQDRHELMLFLATGEEIGPTAARLL